MCVIIHKPKGVAVSAVDIRAAHRTNGHGFGFMAWDPVDKKIVTRKGINWPIDEIIKIVDNLKDYEAVFHFRIKTHGPIIDKLCHPFKVLDKEKHGTEMFMMHNGVIGKVTIADDKKDSDTSTFVRTMLRPILKHKPTILRTAPFRAFVAEYIGGSKLVFMLEGGEVIKIREEAGEEHAGCWWSNLNGIHGAKTKWERERDNQKKVAGSTQTQVTNHTGTSTVIGVVAKLFGFDIRNNDEVYVYNRLNEDYLEIGKITSLSQSGFYLTFKPTEEDLKIYKGHTSEGKAVVWVTLNDGQVFYQDFKNYFVIPGEYKGDAMPSARPEGAPANNVVPLITTDAAKKVQELIEENKKPADECSTCSDPVVNDVDPLYKVVLGELEFWPNARVGGSELRDSGEEYAGISIMEFNDMDAEARCKFFSENYSVAMNMLQDLVEYFVLQEEVLEGEESGANTSRAIETKHKFESVAKDTTGQKVG